MVVLDVLCGVWFWIVLWRDAGKDDEEEKEDDEKGSQRIDM